MWVLRPTSRFPIKLLTFLFLFYSFKIINIISHGRYNCIFLCITDRCYWGSVISLLHQLSNTKLLNHFKFMLLMRCLTMVTERLKTKKKQTNNNKQINKTKLKNENTLLSESSPLNLLCWNKREVLSFTSHVCQKGPVRESNPGPLAPEARIIPLDQQAPTRTYME